MKGEFPPPPPPKKYHPEMTGNCISDNLDFLVFLMVGSCLQITYSKGLSDLMYIECPIEFKELLKMNLNKGERSLSAYNTSPSRHEYHDLISHSVTLS